MNPKSDDDSHLSYWHISIITGILVPGLFERFSVDKFISFFGFEAGTHAYLRSNICLIGLAGFLRHICFMFVNHHE